MMSEVTDHAILLVNQYGTTVFGICRFVVTQYCRFFFTVRNDGDLVSRNAFTLQVHLNGVSTTLAQGDVVLRGAALIRVTFNSHFVRRVATQEVSVRIQHCSEVRTDVVLVQIEVNDVVLLQLLHLQTRLLFRRHVAAVAVHTSAGTQHAFAALVIAGVLVRRTRCDCHNRQSDHQPFQHFIQLHFFDSFSNQLIIITDTATRQAILPVHQLPEDAL
ncbi:hypothetical protein ESA_02602 [Cronobacter sakazakii ATCC BAA-894]|uniref:Uncharacterized protein n=1 Tax=Cronobacter sakazakii (strain ATCC BAA-894) TaxID=290339 RepID=A7MIW5_CROS8|nr:hypothetical protein ESA_02602 [Cronobacter sakazakii ATCC BAA-894]